MKDLPKQKFTEDEISNAVCIGDTSEMKAISLREIFEWIKNQSIKNGLTVELKSDRIIFIKTDKKC